ncbi:unnamed protein product [Penicillium pancosmium]
MAKPIILLRAETKPLEHRSVLTPSSITALIGAGYIVKCERCDKRCFRDEEMEAAGAILVPTNFWVEAPLDHIVVGLKELMPSDNFALEHVHLHFAHVFKEQQGWTKSLLRFARGGGSLLDIEFLEDHVARGRLLAPTSFYAGFCGAILAIQAWARQILHPEEPELAEILPYESELKAVEDTISHLQDGVKTIGRPPTVMIVGASGKCGLGAVDLCQRLGLDSQNILQCGRAQTSMPLFTKQVLQADILINCIYLTQGTKPFVTMDSCRELNRRLSVISDVSCDGEDSGNPIAIYSGHSTFKRPSFIIPTTEGPKLSVISIDHLPSLIPRDASEYCANQLLPSLLKLDEWQTADEWRMAREMFHKILKKGVDVENQTPEVLSQPAPDSISSPDLFIGSNSSVSVGDQSSASSVSSLMLKLSVKPGKFHNSPLEIEKTVSPPFDTFDPLMLGFSDFDTKAVHAGHRQYDPATGAVSMPIIMSSTYAQAAADNTVGEYVYSRKANPNRSDFERSVAALEQAKYGLAFASGSAAIAMVVHMLEPYSNIIAIADTYAGTQRTFTLMAESLRISTTYVEGKELAADLGKYVAARTKMIWIESPSNPLLQIVDVRTIATEAHRMGILVVVDNTIASPFIFNPLVHGADITVHSATKHLAGHNDVVLGVLATNSKELRDRLAFLQNAIGAVPSPFDCWLASRGLRTFHLRINRANSSAQAIAEALENSLHVVEVMYPGLESHPEREIVKKQHNHGGAGGGIISFRIKGGFKAAEDFCRSLRLFTLAESFGSVQSLCEVPGPMTHKLLTSEQRAAIGVYDDLVRLSVGVEAPDDLTEDVLRGLESACAR